MSFWKLAGPDAIVKSSSVLFCAWPRRPGDE